MQFLMFMVIIGIILIFIFLILKISSMKKEKKKESQMTFFKSFIDFLREKKEEFRQKIECSIKISTRSINNTKNNIVDNLMDIINFSGNDISYSFSRKLAIIELFLEKLFQEDMSHKKEDYLGILSEFFKIRDNLSASKYNLFKNYYERLSPKQENLKEQVDTFFMMYNEIIEQKLGQIDKSFESLVLKKRLLLMFERRILPPKLVKSFKEQKIHLIIPYTVKPGRKRVINYERLINYLSKRKLKPDKFGTMFYSSHDLENFELCDSKSDIWKKFDKDRKNVRLLHINVSYSDLDLYSFNDKEDIRILFPDLENFSGISSLFSITVENAIKHLFYVLQDENLVKKIENEFPDIKDSTNLAKLDPQMVSSRLDINIEKAKNIINDSKSIAHYFWKKEKFLKNELYKQHDFHFSELYLNTIKTTRESQTSDYISFFQNYIRKNGFRIFFLKNGELRPQEEELGRQLFHAYFSRPKSFEIDESPVNVGYEDIIILRFEPELQRIETVIVEVKIYRGPKYFERGIRQLARYLDVEEKKKGFYIVYDLRKQKHDIEKEIRTIDGKLIHIFPIIVERVNFSQA